MSAVDVLRAWLRRENLTIHSGGLPIDGLLEAETLREIALLVRDVEATRPRRWDEEDTEVIPLSTVDHLRELSRAA